mmetsp:Transcript_94250/g.266234  ORF Transcript_94250/g.266234 Transcript_94250/m.266234 type:complete len:107 (-) Transcript_94250:1531-1851(-)
MTGTATGCGASGESVGRVTGLIEKMYVSSELADCAMFLESAEQRRTTIVAHQPEGIHTSIVMTVRWSQPLTRCATKPLGVIGLAAREHCQEQMHTQKFTRHSPPSK